MSITRLTQNRVGGAVVVTAVSSLAAPVYFFWYVDGSFAGSGSSGVRAFVVDAQAVLSVLDSNNVDFDYVANAPEVYPARRKLFFFRSLDARIARYRIEQQKNGGAWAAVATIPHDPTRWQYTYTTGRLDDLAAYAWRVVPLDAGGNGGTAVTLSQEDIVRRPDAPDFTAELQADSTVTFAGVA